MAFSDLSPVIAQTIHLLNHKQTTLSFSCSLIILLSLSLSFLSLSLSFLSLFSVSVSPAKRRLNKFDCVSSGFEPASVWIVFWLELFVSCSIPRLNRWARTRPYLDHLFSETDHGKHCVQASERDCPLSWNPTQCRQICIKWLLSSMIPLLCVMWNFN